MIILGLDWETTGLNPQTDRIIEAGLVLWDTDARRPIRMCGCLVKSDVAISEEITKLTGITSGLLDKFGLVPKNAFTTVTEYMDQCEIICAHNGNEFDKLFWGEWVKREGKKVPEKFWLDTCADLPTTRTKLTYMAADMGFVNPFPHRALTDVLTMLRILDGHDVCKVYERAKLPNATLQANVNYDSNALAKARGYRWKPDSKQWLKIVKENEVESEVVEAKKLGFVAVRIK